MADPPLATPAELETLFRAAVTGDFRPLADAVGGGVSVGRDELVLLVHLAAASGSPDAFGAVARLALARCGRSEFEKIITTVVDESARKGCVAIVEACIALAADERKQAVVHTALAGGAMSGECGVVSWCLLQGLPPSEAKVLQAMESALWYGRTAVLEALLPLCGGGATVILEDLVNRAHLMRKDTPPGGYSRMVLWCLDSGGEVPEVARVSRHCSNDLFAALVRLSIVSELRGEARAAEVEKWRASLPGPPRAAFAFAD